MFFEVFATLFFFSSFSFSLFLLFSSFFFSLLFLFFFLSFLFFFFFFFFLFILFSLFFLRRNDVFELGLLDKERTNKRKILTRKCFPCLSGVGIQNLKVQTSVDPPCLMFSEVEEKRGISFFQSGE